MTPKRAVIEQRGVNIGVSTLLAPCGPLIEVSSRDSINYKLVTSRDGITSTLDLVVPLPANRKATYPSEGSASYFLVRSRRRADPIVEQR